MEKSEENGAQLVLRKAKQGGLVISRVPENTRAKFIELAENDFSGDYGMTLKMLFDVFEEAVNFKSNTDIKLNYIIELVKNKPNPQVQTLEEKDKITLLSGKKIQKGGESDE